MYVLAAHADKQHNKKISSLDSIDSHIPSSYFAESAVFKER